jgi:tRNA modification GTPase
VTRTNDDTIAAISTPPGEGGIGIVRLSGADAIAVVRRIFRSASGRDPDQDRGRVFYGEIVDDGAVVDEVLVHVMRAPHSYTREDVVEINGHGGAGPLHSILESTLRAGARLAQPGEFTRRAFLNGRIDLAQAEAVIDRIRAQTRAGLQAASAAASGGLSRRIYALSDELRNIKANIEAAIDFADQDMPDLVTPALRERVERAANDMRELLATADAGRLLREGASVAIAGRPNVGKSSLFNALVRDARAIVTPHAGTTRDLIEETVSIQGIPVRLTDTAGLRETADDVERLGVEAARRKLSQAALALFVVDGSTPLDDDDRIFADECLRLDAPAVLVLNKCDLGRAELNGLAEMPFARRVSVSAVTGEGLGQLESAIGDLLRGGTAIAPDQALVTRAHQKDSLRRALEAVERLLAGYDASPEFLAMEADDALSALGEITGETTPDDVLEAIFASFCIGK